MNIDPEMALFPIGSVARLLGTDPKVIRNYEKNALVRPSRSQGRHRLYSQRDVERLQVVHYLAQVKKVNISGIKLIMDLAPHLSPDKWASVVAETRPPFVGVEENRES